jgi:predicted nucleic acid-binding OB-fold protein
MTYVKVAVSYDDLGKALVSRLKAAEAEIIKVREEAQKEFLNSPKGLGALAIEHA